MVLGGSSGNTMLSKPSPQHQQQQSRPSGIPMKKPLISQQDFEKLRAEEAQKGGGSPSGGQYGGGSTAAAITPVDEQRDTFSALLNNNFNQLLENNPLANTRRLFISMDKKIYLRKKRDLRNVFNGKKK
jgi:hypothetical protein